MTSLTDKPLILQWEVWLRSLLGLKGLNPSEPTALQTSSFNCSFILHTQKMQNLPFHSQHRQSNGTQAIDQNHRPLHMHFRQCYLLHKMHLMQEDIHRRNRKKNRWPFPRTSTWRSLCKRKGLKNLRDVECNDKDASTPVARHFNLPHHSTQNMTICGLSMHQGNTESRKNL